MKIKLRSSIFWDGKHCEIGEVLDVTGSEAANLIGRGRAIPYSEPEKAATNRAIGLNKSEAEDVTTRKPGKQKAKGK